MVPWSVRPNWLAQVAYAQSSIVHPRGLHQGLRDSVRVDLSAPCPSIHACQGGRGSIHCNIDPAL